MENTTVIINLPELVEKMKFRKAIMALGRTETMEDLIDEQLAIAERDSLEDPDCPF